MRFTKLLLIKDQEFLLLGYPLHLSPDEAELVRALKKHRTLCVPHGAKLSENALAVRICRINKKAMRISGRKLIVFTDGAYRLNPYL